MRTLREYGITASWKPHLPYRPTVAAEHAEAAVEALRRAGLDRREIEKLSPAPSPA